MNYYFLGIGGIGMSAIARYFAGKGCATAGYDRLRSELCAELESENIDIHYIDDIELIDKKFLNPEETLVIYTPAIPNEHAEYQYFRQNNFKILKRAEILGQITKTERGLCIAGTHGKTTISTMTAHLFKQSSIDCSAFLGGISLNYNNNLLLSNRSDLVVIEADEYDRSFHQLTPCMAVISATDADHLDIYHTHNEYISAFEKFTSLIVEGGALIYKKGTKLEPKVQKNVKVYDYSATEKADFYAENIFYEYGHLLFDFVTPKGKIECIDLGVPMLINVENAVAAMALAWLNGMSAEEISHGIASYRGVKRRFEKHLSEPKIFIDDYAHHPQELEQSIKSVKKLYPDKKVLGVFQPHLYSRTQDFYCEFASALSNLDEIVLVEIYPAREKPIEGVTSQLIYNQIDNPHKTLTSKTKLLDVLAEKDFDVLLTLGAGDIDAYIPKIKDLLTREGTKAQKSKRQGINKICTFVHSYIRTTTNKIKNLQKIILILVLFGGFGTIFAQNNSENNGIEIKVKHLSDANYVSSAEVEKMLRNKGLYSEKTLPSHINTSKINSVVEALAGVKSAKCYISKNNKLVVEITQCKPLFRVMKSNGRNFFVSEDGKIVEAGAGFFVDIPIVTTSTEVKIEFAKGELSEFVKFIENDDFLKNLVVQIVSERTKNGKDSITLIPRAGNQVIIVGELHDADNEPNFKAKLNRLKTFYEKQVLDVKGWNAYSKIDLRFKNKIYCTKKN